MRIVWSWGHLALSLILTFGIGVTEAADSDGRSSNSPEASSGAVDLGQNVPSDGSQGERANGEKLPEVLVTAQKREERLIDTPQSVTNISSDDLTRLGVTQINDFANTVPGLSLTSDGAGFSQVTLRGVTTGNIPVSPTVGIYVDDVPIGSTSAFGFGGRFGLDLGIFDTDRIEVLRGPQGTLYGASTMGGLIKYVSKSPDVNNFGVDLQYGVADIQNGGVSYIGSSAVNVPIIANSVAMRASVYYSRDGGFVDNIALDNKNANRDDIYGGRLDVLFKPSEALSIRIGALMQDIARDGQGSVDYSYDGTPLYGDLRQHRLLSEPFDQHFRLVSGKADYDFGPITLSWISSYQTMQTQQVYDFSASYVPAFGGAYSAVGLPDNTSTHKFAQEVRLASNSTERLEWLIGAFYTHEASDDQESFLLHDPAGLLTPNNLFIYAAPSTYAEAAAFGNLTFKITDRFDISGGVRYSHDSQGYAEYQTGLFGDVSTSGHSREGEATYLADARYHFDDHATGYLRYATGYRPGGPNFVAYDMTTHLPLAPNTFQSDSLKSYEGGYKVETEDRRYGLDLAVYYIRWDDVQLTTSRGGFAVILNAPGGATVRGTELTLTAHPADGLSATGAFAYQDPRMSQADYDLGAARGERLPNVARFTAAVTTDYEFQAVAYRPSLGVVFRYVTDRDSGFDDAADNPQITPQYRLPAYSTTDIHNGYTFGPVQLQLYIHNLFNERGELSAYTNYGPSVAQVTILQPRTYGLSASTHF